MSLTGVLNAELQRVASRTGVRGGRRVPLSYGSAAGELAVCMRSVGLVDREDLRVTEIQGDPLALDLLTSDALARELRPGEAASRGLAVWGRTGGGTAVVIGPEGTPLSPFPDGSGRSPATAALAIAEDSLVAIGVVGPATATVLAMLVSGAVPVAGRYDSGARMAEIAGAPTSLVAIDGSRALLLVERDRAVAAWNEVRAAGRPFGLGYVGAEAAERFEIARCRAASGEPVPV